MSLPCMTSPADTSTEGGQASGQEQPPAVAAAAPNTDTSGNTTGQPQQPNPAPVDGQAKNGDAGGKTFTQQDLDRLINERLQRAEQSWAEKQAEERKKLAAALGIEDPNAAPDPAKALEDAQGTASKAQERADRAEAKALALAAGIKPERIDRFVKLVDIGGALKDVDRGDEAAVSAALKSAVDGAIEDVPEFKGSTLPASSGGDRSGGAPKSTTVEQFKAMDVNERTKLYQENPGLYKQLTEQAKK